ncbi:MAG: NAD(P)H-dependent glycerol-3-phosphate dehydrogenase [Lautropia sp.]|nr:NAD(P)H-dependent glycerol-3-phosphate dehydrogenase [Lautropia sp.]
MKIAILGAGAWGTALAVHVAARHEALLWSRNAAVIEAVRTTRINQPYLPDVRLPEGLGITDSLSGAVAGADLVVLATSVAGLRPVARTLFSQVVGEAAPGVVCLAKGLEAGSGKLAHEVLAEELPGWRIGCLSGPSFAEEVAAGLPVALTAASMEASLPHQMVEAFHHGAMRVYRSGDLVGVEIAGALKNVMAVASGICDGMGLGLNARSALLTRGLAEITRFGMAHGAQPETFLGLAGVGDLVLTCTGDLSRNRRVGLALGRGQTLAEVLAGLGHVAEGVACCPAVVAKAERLGVDLPISRTVLAVIEGRLSAREGVAALLAREPRSE